MSSQAPSTTLSPFIAQPFASEATTSMAGPPDKDGQMTMSDIQELIRAERVWWSEASERQIKKIEGAITAEVNQASEGMRNSNKQYQDMIWQRIDDERQERQATLTGVRRDLDAMQVVVQDLARQPRGSTGSIADANQFWQLRNDLTTHISDSNASIQRLQSQREQLMFQVKATEAAVADVHREMQDLFAQQEEKMRTLDSTGANLRGDLTKAIEMMQLNLDDTRKQGPKHQEALSLAKQAADRSADMSAVVGKLDTKVVELEGIIGALRSEAASLFNQQQTQGGSLQAAERVIVDLHAEARALREQHETRMTEVTKTMTNLAVTSEEVKGKVETMQQQIPIIKAQSDEASSGVIKLQHNLEEEIRNLRNEIRGPILQEMQGQWVSTNSSIETERAVRTREVAELRASIEVALSKRTESPMGTLKLEETASYKELVSASRSETDRLSRELTDTVRRTEERCAALAKEIEAEREMRRTEAEKERSEVQVSTLKMSEKLIEDALMKEQQHQKQVDTQLAVLMEVMPELQRVAFTRDTPSADLQVLSDALRIYKTEAQQSIQSLREAFDNEREERLALTSSLRNQLVKEAEKTALLQVAGDELANSMPGTQTPNSTYDGFASSRTPRLSSSNNPSANASYEAGLIDEALGRERAQLAARGDLPSQLRNEFVTRIEALDARMRNEMAQRFQAINGEVRAEMSTKMGSLDMDLRCEIASRIKKMEVDVLRQLGPKAGMHALQSVEASFPGADGEARAGRSPSGSQTGSLETSAGLNLPLLLSSTPGPSRQQGGNDLKAMTSYPGTNLQGPISGLAGLVRPSPTAASQQARSIGGSAGGTPKVNPRSHSPLGSTYSGFTARYDLGTSMKSERRLQSPGGSERGGGGSLLGQSTIEQQLEQMKRRAEDAAQQAAKGGVNQVTSRSDSAAMDEVDRTSKSDGHVPFFSDELKESLVKLATKVNTALKSQVHEQPGTPGVGAGTPLSTHGGQGESAQLSALALLERARQAQSASAEARSTDGNSTAGAPADGSPNNAKLSGGMCPTWPRSPSGSARTAGPDLRADLRTPQPGSTNMPVSQFIRQQGGASLTGPSSRPATTFSRTSPPSGVVSPSIRSARNWQGSPSPAGPSASTASMMGPLRQQAQVQSYGSRLPARPGTVSR